MTRFTGCPQRTAAARSITSDELTCSLSVVYAYALRFCVLMYNTARRAKVDEVKTPVAAARVHATPADTHRVFLPYPPLLPRMKQSPYFCLS